MCTKNERILPLLVRHEEKDKYDAWFPEWFNKLSAEDRQLLDFLKRQRNHSEKRGCAEVDIDWEFIPITEVRSGNRGHPAYGGSIGLVRLERRLHVLESCIIRSSYPASSRK